ncbi:MAG: hypothetical protein JW849_00370 [Phycisphaerae bacterium]|nr:hypothetical protein [Phycisphaerae bacterium]
MRIGILLLAFWPAACHELRSGVVVSAEPPPLLHFREFSPRVFVESLDGGKSVRLDKLGGPFYVIAFVEPPGDDAGYLNPVLTEMARELWLDSIRVIQITLPTDVCPLKEPQRRAVNENVQETKDNFARFFDPNKIAWEAYWRPRPGAILVVDRCSIIPVIDERSTLADPRRIIDRVEYLQQQWEYDTREYVSTPY